MVQRGYSARVINKPIEKVKLLKREDVLKRVEKVDRVVGRPRAVFKFDRRLLNLDSIFRTNWQIMVEDEQRLLGAFPEPPIICFRRGKNV